MARVVVVGGGFAGLSAAARLAKLRHDVLVVEASDRLGGRLRPVDVDGHPFALDVETVTLPGVLRDLFRKSGRPLERVADLTLAGPRRHVYRSGEVLDLPFGDRAAQHDAVVAGLEVDEWTPWVDGWPERWDLVRRTWLDPMTAGRADLDRRGRRELQVGRSVGRLAGRQLKDPALEKIVVDPLRLEGQDRRLVPAFTAVRHYVERTFGRWGFEGGLATLADALEQRLGERKVEIRLGATVDGLVVEGDLRRGGRVTGVAIGSDELAADVVVWCAPRWPAPLPSPSLTPAIPACRTFVRVDPGAVDLPDDVVVHGNPPLRLWHSGDGCWTITHLAGERPLDALARVGVDLRPALLGDPVTWSPSDLVRVGHWGWQWQRWGTLDEVPGVGRPRTDLFLAGAHAWPSTALFGGTVEEIGMTTAALADHLGPAPR